MAEQLDFFSEPLRVEIGVGKAAGKRRSGAARPAGAEVCVKLSAKAVGDLAAIRQRDGHHSDAAAITAALAAHAVRPSSS